MPSTVTLAEMEAAIIRGEATREEILEVLAKANRKAKRLPARNRLSELNPEHARIHGWLDLLLDREEAAAKAATAHDDDQET